MGVSLRTVFCEDERAVEPVVKEVAFRESERVV